MAIPIPIPVKASITPRSAGSIITPSVISSSRLAGGNPVSSRTDDTIAAKPLPWFN